MRVPLLYAFCAQVVVSTALPNAEAAPHCLKQPTDPDWPAESVWKSELPGIIAGGDGTPGPNYRLQAQKVADVQKAVKFASKHNIRLSIITTGHDQIGRSNLGSGLLIDLSKMDKIQVSESYTPVKAGVPAPASKAGNSITPKPGSQAAVTIGPGVSGQMANDALKRSNLFVVCGTHGSISLVGGWGQSGGYGPLSAQYGLGSDQWLEAKVVTADGRLVTTNSATNPDLLWALRGGGGGNFGVVVQATIKAYPNVPVTAIAWYLNSTSPPSTPEQAAKGIHPTSESMKYLLAQLPELQAKNVSAYLYPLPKSVRAWAIHPGTASGLTNVNAVWGPILQKMSSYPGMLPFQSKVFEFKTYQEFYDKSYGAMEAPHKDKRDIQKRHGPAGSELPRWRGVFNYDSRLLGAKHLRDPNFMQAISSSGGRYGVLLCSPGSRLSPANETSVVPAWRDAVVHFAGGRDDESGTNMDNLRQISPEMGAYINEAYTLEKNWAQSFWGANYPRLSQIKTKYDPKMLFWTTPGVHADHMEVLNGRVCHAKFGKKPSQVPPINEKRFAVDLAKDRAFYFGDLELPAKRYPEPGTLVGLPKAPLQI